ncbi:DNA-binding protein [Halomicrobium mukohataei]|uniref:DNA-binding protein n=1 Tax=Halomicrobium mukohataei TaxID=57705 RepID=A0A847UHH0_9EURY|nr:helix-turn-helix transcriptional regulator [Halomicrobium mukohataei]NLV10701.1 DNA-binding protein [Halomicrobium mukohataei]
MTTWFDRTGFQRDLLHAVAALEADDELPYGLALKEWLGERYSDPVNHSRLYQNLDALTEDGLIQVEAVDDRTNAYRLTDAGRDAFEAHVESVAAISGREADAEPTARADGGDGA